MQYICLENSETSFTIAKQTCGVKHKFTPIATCRSRFQAERLVSFLNGTNDKTLEMVKEFHDVFKIPRAQSQGVPGVEDEDIRQWYKEIGEGLGNAAGLVKAACAKMREEGKNVQGMLRMQLMVEELGEVLVAMSKAHKKGGMKEVLHEMADLRYVVDGSFDMFGLSDVAIAAVSEIHRANMSKLDEKGEPVTDASGRVLKSKMFRKADVSFLIREAA